MTNKSRLIIASITATLLLFFVSYGIFYDSFSNPGANYISNQLTSTPEPKISTPTPEPKTTPTLIPTSNPTATSSPTPLPVPIDFTYNAGSSYAFTVTVAVDLNDGMNKDESIIVAESVFNHELRHATYEVKSANSSDEGIWSVYLLWGAISSEGISESHSHYFNVEIDPLNRTVSYSRCY